jgi:hypothetical protein
MNLLLIRTTSVHSTPTHPISLRRISILFSNLSSAVLIPTKIRAGRERIRVWISPLQDQYLLWGTSPLVFSGYQRLSSVMKWQVVKLTTYPINSVPHMPLRCAKKLLNFSPLHVPSFAVVLNTHSLLC